MQTRNRTIRAFTLVEVLTTVAIIGILLAVLVPALNQVGKSALVVKQKAQFHTIEMALEAFRSDVGQYPPSAWDAGNYSAYSASQRLAEALVGRDGFGFHPASRYHRDGRDKLPADGGIPLYYPDIGNPPFTDADRAANLASRKGPYLELESANAIPLLSYGIYGDLVSAAQPSYVLADVFKTAKLTTGRKTGMPILYYRADRFKTGHSAATLDANTYNVMDSINMAPMPVTPQNPFYPLYSDHSWFYQKTQNPNFTSPPRPYRAESFILHSAGPDGKFGTVDDLFNFDEGN